MRGDLLYSVRRDASQDLVLPVYCATYRLHALLALYIHRSDLEEHCSLLAGYHSCFQGFNEMPEFVDRFEPPLPSEDDNLMLAGHAEVLKHGFPKIDETVVEVMMVHNSPTGKGLNRVYVLTNGKREWLDGLRAVLNRATHWKSVATSRDMMLKWEQEYIGQATDMFIAERADVFTLEMASRV